MTTNNIAYAAKTSLTITLNSLATSATVGQGSLAVDNTSTNYLDYLLQLELTTGAGALGSDFAAYLLFYGSLDGTTFSGSSAEAVGTNAAVTIDSPTNLIAARTLAMPASSKVYGCILPLSSIFGGVIPPFWGIVVRQFSGQALASSGNSASYRGVTSTNS